MRFYPRIGILVGIVSMIGTACALGHTDVQTAKDVTKTSLTALQTACVIANAFFPAPEIAKVCKIVGPAADLILPLASSTRIAGAARPHATPVTCEETDAGVVCETR